MHQAILEARKSIFWEVYMFVDDSAGSRFMDALSEKARQGVDVKLILDGIGSRLFSKEAETRLRESGARVLWYNHLRFEINIKKWIKRLWYRNHRKILIIDGNKIFIGGVNVSASSAGWNDLQMQLTGVRAPSLLRSFARSFVSCGGDKNEVKKYLISNRLCRVMEKTQNVKFIIHSPMRSARRPFLLRRFYWRALKLAKKEFNLATPYYVPDARFLRLMALAKSRGAQVNIILPWKPDHKIMQRIAGAFYDLTRKLGASLYFLPKMNHAKAFTVDDTMGMVGSINLTPRSFFSNQEIGVYFTDKQMVDDLDKILDGWKSESAPFSADNWRKRGWLRRFREWWAEKIKDYV